MEQEKGYTGILKTTFLFAFVQVFNILIKVVYNKIAAIILGPSGIGLISIFQNTTNIIKTGCGLGIPQSAVKDIAEANKDKEQDKTTNIIGVTDRVVNFTALLGMMVTILLAPFLSSWTIGSHEYVLSYILLSLSACFLILTDGKLAILKGTRRLKDLARANMIGSIMGLVIGIPLFYLMGQKGIVPSLILFSISSYLVVKYFIRKAGYQALKIKFSKVMILAKGMIRMGIALMIVSFLSLLFNLIISFYLSNKSGLSEVGIYNAGVTIISSYFGIILTALTTDYYPRIAAINKNDSALQVEMNRQSEVGLILVFPLVSIFIVFSSTFINILYDSSFESSNLYTNYALIGTIITIVSNCMGMILLAKQATKIFLYSVIIQRTILIGIYIILYNIWGLFGLGLAYIFTGILHLFIMHFILKYKFNIVLNSKVISLLVTTVIFAILMIIVRSFHEPLYKYSLGGFGISISILFCLWYCKKELKINILSPINRFIKK